MTCSVSIINVRKGERTFMASLWHDRISQEIFDPAKIADMIEGWGTIYEVKEIKLGLGKSYAKLYITTTDTTINAGTIRDSIMSCHEIVNTKKQ